MKEYGLLESASVKIQTLKTAIEVCRFVFCYAILISLLRVVPRYVQCGSAQLKEEIGIIADPQSATLLLRVDDIVSARQPEQGGGGQPAVQNMGGEMDGDMQPEQ